MAMCLFYFSYIVNFCCFGYGVFFFRILRSRFTPRTSIRVTIPFVFLPERQAMKADFLPELFCSSIFLTSPFTSHSVCFGFLIGRAFASVKNSSSRPGFEKIIGLLRVLDYKPFAFDLVLGSSRCRYSMLFSLRR